VDVTHLGRVRFSPDVRNVLSRCEPNLRRVMIERFAECPDSRGMIRWLFDNGSIDANNRIFMPNVVEPAPIDPVCTHRQDISTTFTRTVDTSRITACQELYAPNPDKPDALVLCRKHHPADGKHGKNRAVKRGGHMWTCPCDAALGQECARCRNYGDAAPKIA